MPQHYLKAAAAMDGESEGRVVKVIDYDAFGNVLTDSNPALFLPLSFAGGLRDRFTGLVRFCHRDYDPTVGRFTAPDPLGDTGGDHDLYDYCVDEPVGRVDPEGLKDAAAPDTGDPLSGIGAWFSDLGKKIGGMFTPDEAQAAPGNQTTDVGQAAIAQGSQTSNSGTSGDYFDQFREKSRPGQLDPKSTEPVAVDPKGGVPRPLWDSKAFLPSVLEPVGWPTESSHYAHEVPELVRNEAEKFVAKYGQTNSTATEVVSRLREKADEYGRFSGFLDLMRSKNPLDAADRLVRNTVYDVVKE